MDAIQVEGANEAASALATRYGGVVAVAGPVDLVVGPAGSVEVANGDPLLTRVSGGGCALGAVITAFAAVDADRLATITAAVAFYTVAAELAAEISTGRAPSPSRSWMRSPRSSRRPWRSGRGLLSADLSTYLIADTET